MSTIIKNSTKNHLQSIDSYTWIQKLKSELSRQIVNNLTYPTKITVASIAQELHIGEKTLWRKIKEDTKQAPKQYLNELLLQNAHQALVEQKYTTTKKLASCMGYSNASHFAKFFKARFGYTPKALLLKERAKRGNVTKK